MPKVSVIVPVYNAEKYLARCLDSLARQTLRDIEVVAVDDGSTDSSTSILADFAERHPGFIRVFREENSGQGAARNRAIAEATGEYVGFLDADDEALPDMFERLYSAAAGADLAVCDHYFVKKRRRELITFPEFTTPRELFHAPYVSPWNKLVRRETLARSGVVFPEGYIYEDTAWFAELIPFVKSFNYAGGPLLLHYMNDNSTMTAAGGERVAQIFPVMDGLLDFYRERGLFDGYRDELCYFYTRILLFGSMRRISKVPDKSRRGELRRRTLAELEEHFPDFRAACTERGLRGLYIRHASPGTLRLFTALCGLIK